MCLKCLREGKMTQEEYDIEVIEGKKLMKDIQLLLNGKEETIVMNTLLCALINASVDLKVNPVEVIFALANGFNLAAKKIDIGHGQINRKEILN